MSDRLFFFNGKRKIKFSRSVTHCGPYFEYRRRKMNFIGQGGGEKVNTLSLLEKDEESVNVLSLNILGTSEQMSASLKKINDAIASSDASEEFKSEVKQVIEYNQVLKGLVEKEAELSLKNISSAKELESELSAAKGECDMASATGEQLAIVSGEKELLADQLSTTQLLLENEQAAKNQLQIEYDIVNKQILDTVPLVGGAFSADMQVALVANVLKTKEAERAQLASTVQELQSQLQDAADSILTKDNTYANQLEQLRQAAVARENERIEREKQFSQYTTETDERLQMVIAEKNAVDQRATTNVLQLTSVSRDLELVREECKQTVEQKEQQIVNLKDTYDLQITEVKGNYDTILYNKQIADETINRLNEQITRLETSNELMIAGNENLINTELAVFTKDLEKKSIENEKLLINNQALVLKNTDFERSLKICSTNANKFNQQIIDLKTEKDNLGKTNTELTRQVNILNLDKEQLVSTKQEIKNLDEALNTAKQQAASLTRDKTILQLQDAKFSSQIQDLNTKLKQAEGRLVASQTENRQLIAIDPDAALDKQAIVMAKQSLAVAEGNAKVLKVERDNAVKKSQIQEKELLDLKNDLSTKNQQIQINSLSSAKDKPIHDAINQVRVFSIDLEQKQIKKDSEPFDPQTKFSHKSVLVYGPFEERLIKSSIPYGEKLRALQLAEGMQLSPFVQKDPNWNKAEYVILKKDEWKDLRKNYCRPCDEAGPISTTSTTTTQTLLGLGSSAVALNHIEALNQLSWQESTRHLRSYPGDYQVEVKFSRGKPSLGYTEELRFVASNVHLIKDPNYASGDNYYVIDLTRPDTVNNLRYTSVGTLVLNGIHGHGSLAYRITDKTTDELVKDAIIEDYAVEEDATRPYNTKLVFSPGEDVVFYARDTGRDTYILETILIKQ